MRVSSTGQGVSFEWEGEPAPVVRVWLTGSREQNFERLKLLREVIAGSREGGVTWDELGVRERYIKGSFGGPSSGEAEGTLTWVADFGDWRTAALVFTVLGRAIGLDDDGVPLELS